MRLILSISFFLLTGIAVQAQQYYIRGEVRDDNGNALQNVKILQRSTGLIFHTGSYGTFGILSHQKPDTLLFSFDGYKPEWIYAKTEDFLKLVLKLIPATAKNIKRDKLASLTKDLARDVQRKWFTGDETYTSPVSYTHLTLPTILRV